MLSDRDYMRSDDESHGPLRLMMPATLWLIVAVVVTFAVQQIDEGYFGGRYLNYLVLSEDGLRHGYIWQLLTYQFLHGSFRHIFWNVIGIWIFGRFVEERLGRASFFRLYLLSGVAGGILEAAVGFFVPHYFSSGTLGASAGVSGLLAAYATIDPERVFLVCFIVPMRARYLLYISFAIALFFTVVPTETGIAHAAHLGGLIFGAAYIHFGRQMTGSFPGWNPLRRKFRREKMIQAATVKPLRYRKQQAKLEEPVEEMPEEFIAREVDPILDKISAHGIQSLTDRERKILQAARSKMSGQ